MEDNSRPVFTIGIVADIVGVSVQTLRLWENKGLIKPSRKGKDRYYSQDDLKKLKYIKYLLSEKKLNTYGARELLEKEGWKDFETEPAPEPPEASVQDGGESDAPAAPVEKDAGDAAGLRDQKRILIIDDDFDQVSTVKTILESENFEVLTALSGRDGLDKARSEQPDMILLDIMIPDLDGIEICKRLKGSSEHSKIPICILSSIPENMKQKFGLDASELPADAFQHKPVRPGKLLEVVRKLLARG